MAAAYGLYTHIQSNRRRSTLLLIGLFFLVYLMVFAGALAAEAMLYDASLQWLLQAAWSDFLKAAPFATVGTALWILIAYKFHQSLIDMVTGGREVTRQEEPRLYNLLENLCISRGITMPKLKIMEDAGTERVRERHEREAVRHHGHDRAARRARRRRDRGRPRP